jgi:hypothetical protein
MGQFRQAHRDPTPADVSGLRGGDGGVTPVFLDGIGSALPSSAQAGDLLHCTASAL